MKLIIGMHRGDIWECDLPDILPYKDIVIDKDGKVPIVNVNVGNPDGTSWYERLPVAKVPI